MAIYNKHKDPADLTTPASGTTVTFYDESDGKFKQKDSTGAVSEIGSTPALSELTDVTLGTASDGDLLTYSNGEWVNAEPVTPPTPELALDDLTDVIITSAENGQVLTANIIDWQSYIVKDPYTPTLVEGLTYQFRTDNPVSDYIAPGDIIYLALISQTYEQALENPVTVISVDSGSTSTVVYLDTTARSFYKGTRWLFFTKETKEWVNSTPLFLKSTADYSVAAINSGIASGYNSSILGGSNNIAEAYDSVVLGGQCNSILAPLGDDSENNQSAILGGYQNTISGGYCSLANVIGGGKQNSIGEGSYQSGIMSGFRNTVTGNSSIISGGNQNVILSDCSFIGGGQLNSATADFSTISGGYCNNAIGCYSSILGGTTNTAVYDATVGGGYTNTASGYYSSILGGNNNTASGYGSTIGGGGINSASGCYSSILGGVSNTASGYRSIVGGGFENCATGEYSVVTGGSYNIAGGNYSAILGGTLNNDSNFDNVHIIGSNITADMSDTTFVNKLSIKSIPTASTDLPSGAIWSNNGVLTIVS